MSLRILSEEWYPPKPFKEGDQYLIRALTGIEALPVVNYFKSLAARALREGGEMPGAIAIELPEEFMANIINNGLLNWRGITDGNGVDIEFKKGMGESLPFDKLDEVVGEIIQRSRVTVEQEKNLSSQLKSKKRRKNSTA